MYWENLLKEVLNRNTRSIDNLDDGGCPAAKHRHLKRKFYLGDSFGNVYFTAREAEVMIQLIHGKTLSSAATMLNLSPRTIEFYVKNMKTKLSCRTKSELIGKVFASDFVRNIDFLVHVKGE